MLEIHRIAGALGAEIAGVDLAQDLDDDTIAAIRQAWLDHLVIFFRGRDLPPERFLAFARPFGEVVEYPFIEGIEGLPLITPVVKLEHERVNFGGLWHSDTAYLERPPMGTMLIAREVPPYGGDTLFANMYLAWGTLSPGLQRMLDGLIAINSSAKADVTKTREDRLRDGARPDARHEYVAEHPVVRTHPTTRHYIAVADVAPGESMWSIVFPDFAGVTSAAAAFADVPQQARDALATAVEDMIAEGEDLPAPVEEGRQAEPDPSAFHNPRYIVVPVEVRDKPTRINVSMDRSLLKRIDDAAARCGMTRSGFLAESARKLVRAISDQYELRKG
jgi:taurine dioxygenase